ncbi:hypothetical protein SRABI106_04274 [Rahnella aquatilis]|nr:hypothetical protein SRABI106_04274 [Rahnella aquatilis]
MDFVGQRHDMLLDILVIDSPFDRLPDLRFSQIRMRGIGRQHKGAGDTFLYQREVFVVDQRTQLLGGQVAGDIHIAFLQHQQLSGRVDNMAHDDALNFACVRVVLVAFQNHGFTDFPVAQLERTGTGTVFLQPGITQIVTGLIRQTGGFLHDTADVGGQAIQQEGFRCRFSGFDHQSLGVRRGNQALDVIFGVTKLVNNVGRALIEFHNALQGESGVFGSNRFAIGPFGFRIQFEGEGFFVVRSRPGHCQIAFNFIRGGQFRFHQLLIHITGNFTAHGLKAFMRIKAGNDVELNSHDQY